MKLTANVLLEGIEDVIGFIKREQGETEPRMEEEIEMVADEPKRSFFDKFKF